MFRYLTYLSCCLLVFGYELDSDVEKWAEKFINKGDAETMRKQLSERSGDGYGTEFIMIPDGEGVPQKASLHSDKKKFWFGDGRSDDEEPVTEKPIGEEVLFRLYTRKNPTEGEPINVEDPSTVRSSNYDPAKPTKVVVHGWKSSGDSDTVVKIKDGYCRERKSFSYLNKGLVRPIANFPNGFLPKAYLERSDVNVVGVDWSSISSNYNYLTPAGDTVRVGEHVGKMVDVMAEERGARHEDFHLIGHSLGAHVAGAAGSSTKRKVSRVTGLDPALPGFQYYQHADGRLDESDAEFVEVIHTCSGALGMSAPAGHADFYPNGGSPFQPGCCCYPEFTEACSHGRAHQYFAESIITDKPFEAKKCETWDQFKRSECSEENIKMGEDTPETTRGVYYLMTNYSAPYALGEDGARYSLE